MKGIVLLFLLVLMCFSFLNAEDTITYRVQCTANEINYAIECSDANVQGYYSAEFVCPNGVRTKETSEICQTKEYFVAKATEKCANNCVNSCTTEGESMPVYPGYSCCAGLTAIPTTTKKSDGTYQALVGASICSKCGNGACESWENYANCSSDCKVTSPPEYRVNTNTTPIIVCTQEYAPVCAEKPVVCITTPCDPIRKTYSNKCYAIADGATPIYAGECKADTTAKENVDCIFTNANSQQSCYTEGASCTAYPIAATCSGGSITSSGTTTSTSTTTCQGTIARDPQTISCSAYVSGEKGKQLTWKSSCGGYAHTTIDGQQEKAIFECASTVPETVKEQVKCVFDNAMEQSKCYSSFGGDTFSCVTEQGNNYGTCIADVIAPKGTKLMWKSTCGGYASTIVDGQNEYAQFTCSGGGLIGCGCTADYAPVCAEISVCTATCKEAVDFSAKSDCTESCYSERKKFSNECEARCVGAKVIEKGECGAACPNYSQPYCPTGKIEIVYDDHGCKKSRCVSEEAEHFTGAYWKCSNGKEFKEMNSCMPYSYWKEKARNTCAARSTKCGTASTTGGGGGGASPTTATSPTTSTTNPVSGNFLLEIVQAATSAVTTTATSTATEQVPQPTVSTDTSTKCLDGEVFVTAFEAFGSCTPNSNECKYYVDQQGCKIKSCTNGTQEKICPKENSTETNTYREAYWQCYSGKEFIEGGESSCKPIELWKQYAEEACKNECGQVDVVCEVKDTACEEIKAKCGIDSFKVWNPCYDGKPTICSTQTEEELATAKEKCYANKGELKVELNSDGCRTYSCTTETNECKKLEDVSGQKKIKCEERGGELLTKVDEQGCLVYLECAGEKINDENASINEEILTDKMKLLNLAIKMENAKIEIEQTVAKIREIAKYYEGQGKTEQANKFNKAANILEAAAQKLDEIKQEIKNNVDNFDEGRAKKIRELIRTIKEELLKEALLEMLG